MSQAAAQQPSRKKTVISLLVLLALTCIIVFTFKDHWAEITTALAQLSVWQVLAVLAVGISYPLLEGCVAWVIVRSRLPQFTLRQGLDVGWCGTFGNVVTLGAGAVPVQLYYLHRAGLPLGPGAGLMTLEYVFHKTTVLLYATVMLLLQRRWLAANTTGVMRYLPMAYAVVAVIIVALVLLCVSPLVQNLARWLLGRIRLASGCRRARGLMLLARLLPFLIVAALLIFLWRRSVRKRRGPDFQGPVYTVDYKVVDEDEGSQDPPSDCHP